MDRGDERRKEALLDDADVEEGIAAEDAHGRVRLEQAQHRERLATDLRRRPDAAVRWALG